MRKNIMGELSLTAMSFVIATSAFASEVKIINYTDSKAHVYFRGKDKTKNHIVTLAPKGMDQSVVTHKINANNVENASLFEAIASTGEKGNPDWKPGAGTCTNLELDKDYTILIESSFQGLTTSCTILDKK